MAHCKEINVIPDDRTPHKWIMPLTEEAFQSLISKGGGSSSTVHKIFGDGSLFSPMLFGKFFDPSDAFPLWDFEASVLLSGLRSSGVNKVDWFRTDKEFVLTAELPGTGEDTVQICIEKGKILEICGQRTQQKEHHKGRDWRSSHWWENGFVRRIELPEKANWKQMEAKVKNDVFLEITIPVNGETHQGSNLAQS